MVGVLLGASNRSKGAGQLMIAIILIAIAAGCASALMFASLISGALISLLLFYLAPLPLMVAALGWGPLCATIGGIAAATVLGTIFGLPYCIAFVVTAALPAASAMRRTAIISCPAPFERLEVFQQPQPSATGQPGSLMKKVYPRR